MSQFKNKYRKIRNQFSRELREAMQTNAALAMLCIVTYEASKHRTHIMKIWSMSINHPSFQEEYKAKLIGKHLTGENDIFRSLIFTVPEIAIKYRWKIPRDMALGDAYGVALSALLAPKEGADKHE
ncbi:hypothetical protein HP548_00635 [Paenibacillus taichungensis]|uniref:Uncharacterized protein n=1 Tax=Paenibacillus taichungensis TaxID=484184 RepID=A0ABX2MIE0_9BACL|nr:hypothetical protein [Paenibacillus taichungensis]NUU52617.1 hypothetical protein [Paenibacillus taichungensis]